MIRIILTILALSPSLLYGQMTYNGSGNNVTHPEWGMAEGHIERQTSNGYADSISAPGGITRPNPREISNVVFDQQQFIPNQLNISDFGWAFGQFIDHDITFVDDHPTETFDIPVPLGDQFFDPYNTGTQVIPMKRSEYDPGTGTSTLDPRMHMNSITSWIDASNVYGSDSVRAMYLRSFVDGKLRTSAGNYLPFNTTTGELNDPIDPNAPFMFNENPTITKFFVAGDVRANEQPILTSLHTLFMRDHNRFCDELVVLHPTWNDEEIYQRARRMVIGEIQAITYEEWLPALGIDLGAYAGYDNQMNPNIMNVFSAAAFRLGHTLINSQLQRLDQNGNVIPQGNIDLKDAFFNPHVVINEGGVEPFFRGMVTQRQQNFDTKVISDLRNFLFGPPGAGGLDLVSININRGRERGLVDYNTIRADMGMTAHTTFSDITSDANLQSLLQTLYGTIDNIDPWVGMLSEDHLPGAAMGEAVHNILHHQFLHLRDGDRFYYENDPTLYNYEVTDLKNTRLADVILRNTNITNIKADVFFVIPDSFPTAVEPTLVPESFALELYPNPTAGDITLTITLDKDEEVEIRILDELGKTIEQYTTRLAAGDNKLNAKFSKALPSGTYIVQVRSGTASVYQKLIKL